MNKKYNTLTKFVRHLDSKKEKDIRGCRNYLKESTRFKLKNKNQTGSNIPVFLISMGQGNPWTPPNEEEKMCPCYLVSILEQMNEKCFPYFKKILAKEGIILDEEKFEKIKKQAEKDCQSIVPKDREGRVNITEFNENSYTKFDDDFGELIRSFQDDEDEIDERDIRELLSVLVDHTSFFNKESFREQFGIVYEGIENLENLKEILEHYKLQKKLKDRIYKHAIWGAYFKKTTKKSEYIEIYLDPIYAFSKKTGLDPYLMYRQVLIHELSHGYHHKGIDANKNIWDSFWNKPKKHTKKAQDNIIEGLAQWYTFNYMFELDKSENRSKSIYKTKGYGKSPVLDNVYTMLVSSSFQASEYNYYKKWLMFSDENMRNAIMSARIDNTLVFEKEFNNNLQKKHKQGL